MSVAFTQLEPPSETGYLRERVTRLRDALEWASDGIPVRAVAGIAATLERVEERLRLGVDSTIVALAGGTGSGKSSLFNALTRSEFAVAGLARPTTAQPSAASWGIPADALLDWIGVARDRRLVRSAGEGDEDAAFRGMVLLDLPDHDSVETTHREVADRIVPMADLVLWVVDPQKYADNVLHSRYLLDVAHAGAPSAVVLNQIDRLTRGDTDKVMFDVRRLLAEKGIESAPVLLTSVTTGAGIDSLRSVLSNAVKRRSVAAEAVRADLVGIGRTLAEALGSDAEPRLPSIEQLAVDLARAAGVDAMAEAADAIARTGKGSMSGLARLTAASVEPIRTRWLDAASAGLPRPWRAVLARSIARPKAIATAVAEALQAVVWPAPEAARGFLRRKSASVGPQILARGREAAGAAILPTIVEPTRAAHLAFRTLIELTDLEVPASDG